MSAVSVFETSIDRQQSDGTFVQLGDAGGFGAWDMHAVDGDVDKRGSVPRTCTNFAFALVTLERDTRDATALPPR